MTISLLSLSLKSMRGASAVSKKPSSKSTKDISVVMLNTGSDFLANDITSECITTSTSDADADKLGLISAN